MGADGLSTVTALNQDGSTHFQYTAVNTGVRNIMGTAQLPGGQIGGHDQGKIGLVAFINNRIYLFQGIF